MLPAALPAIFAGLRISAGLSVIGAIVGDFFFGRGDVGIGQLLRKYADGLDSEQLFAAVILSSMLGVAGVPRLRLAPAARHREGGTTGAHEMRDPPSSLAGLLVVATTACGDDDDDNDVAGTTAARGRGLAAVCPDPLVVQTDWFPESEHGALYELVGEGYEVDAGQRVVRGPMVAGGEPTGIDIEVRAGGPAISNPVSVVMHTDDAIHLGYGNTEGQVTRYDETPTISVVAPLEINPQIIYWDPETYPEIETLADLGEEGVVINVFPAGTFSAVFVAEGIWDADQIDPSYDGSPRRFIGEDGAIAQQGFASAEPYTYEHVYEEWGRPLAFQTLHDAGFEVYSQTLTVVPERLEELAPCLEQVVPMVQQAAIDFLDAPDRANAIIIDAVAQFDTFWTYDEGLADVLGGDPARAGLRRQRSRRHARQHGRRAHPGRHRPDPRRRPRGRSPISTAEDLYTNEFIDESIGM